VDPSSKEEIEAAIKAVRETLESEDVAEIQARTQALQEAFHKVSEAMYAQAAQAQSGGATNGAGTDGAAAADSDDGEVIDAEVVDEGKAS
jgi:molecular chaperone DnaK